jgi:hypothetical protein
MTSVQAELSATRLLAEPNIHFHALVAHKRGWSVIPLLGGEHARFGKRPCMEWKKYQQQLASERQIETWFSEDCTAYGVVCGSISNLIVIDFDDVEIQAEFIQRFSHLLETYLVQSGLRKTLHVYLQTDFPVSTTKLRGGDLKAAGSYVVGAGSQIAGGEWQVVNDVPLYSISEVELNQFLLEFGIQQHISSQLSNLADEAKSADDFIRIYQFLVNELDSRNESLFRTGCYMRDEGYSLEDVIAVLAPIHTNQQPTQQHKAETHTQRSAEAERTIHSVFTKPPRPSRRQTTNRADASYLPNALREAILKEADGTAFLRVYEGLLLSGKAAGDSITEREVLELLSVYSVGRPSVRVALNFTISPALRNPPHAVADISILDMPTKTCVFVQTTEGDKTLGRPAQRYIIPEIHTLCKLMKIENIGSDPITLQDIQSPATYRAALNRELIKRRPGKYSQTWLGNRLNMSERTLQRYLKRENIQSRQLLEETHIDWSNLNQIPTQYGAKRAGFDMQPYFLQDEQGKRYPPKPEIAKKLLKQKHSVWLMKRSINMYWYGHELLAIRQLESSEKPVPSERVWFKPDYPISAPEVVVPTQSIPIQSELPIVELVPSSKNTLQSEPPSEPKTYPKRNVRFYKKPLPNDKDEWLAQQIYRATGNLQEIEARQLVDKYGREAVGRALGRMEFMRGKGDLQNPAGFMKVVSRVLWRSTQGFDVPAPEYKSPKKRKPRKMPYSSEQDPIWQSQAYRQWRLSFADASMDIWNIPTSIETIKF